QEAMKDAEASPLTEVEGPAVTRAEGLARAAEEKVAVQQLIRARRSRFEEIQKKSEEAHQDQIAKLTSEVEQLEKLSRQPAAGTRAAERLYELQSQTERLQSEARKSREQTRAAIQSLADRLRSVQTTLEQSKAIDRSLYDLTRALNSEKSIVDFITAA